MDDLDCNECQDDLNVDCPSCGNRADSEPECDYCLDEPYYEDCGYCGAKCEGDGE